MPASDAPVDPLQNAQEQLEDVGDWVSGAWDVGVDAWRDGRLEVELGHLAVAVAIFLVFMLLRRVFSRLVLKRLKQHTDQPTTALDGGFVIALEPPVRVAFVVLGLFMAVSYLDVAGGVRDFLDRVMASLATLALFWAFYNLAHPVGALFQRIERFQSLAMVDWLVRLARVVVVLLGLAAVLEQWGIAIGPVLAGLGLVSAAVALGAQDLFKNLIAGVLILSEQRFRRGDWIRVDGVVEGTVEHIGFRSTLLRRFDLAPVYVPNADLADKPVINFTLMSFRRIYWTIGVRHDTSIDQLRHIRDGIEAYILGNGAFAHPPQALTFVRIDRFTESSIDIMVYCFTRSTAWGNWLREKEALAFEVKRLVAEAGTRFAVPARSVQITGAEAPEVFVPPETEGTKPAG